MGQLKSTINTPEIEEEIDEIAGLKFGDNYSLYYEHGQWWVIVEDDESSSGERSYSVVTCGHGSGFGHTDIDFEEL